MASNSGEFLEDGLGDDSMPVNDEADYENFFGTRSLSETLDVEIPGLDLEIARPFTQLELPIMPVVSSGQITDSPGQDVVGKGQPEQRKQSNSPTILTKTRDRNGTRAGPNTIPAGAMVIDVDVMDMSAEFPVIIKEEDPDLPIIRCDQPIHIKQEPGHGKFEYWNFTDKSIDLSSDGEYEQSSVDIQRLRTQSPQIPTSTDEQLAAEISSQDLLRSHESSGAITSVGTDSNNHVRNRAHKAPEVEDFSETEGQSPKETVESDTETIQEEDVPSPEIAGQGDTSNIPINRTTFNAGTSMLKSPNPQAKHTEAHIAIMKRVQLILAERSRKKPHVAGAGAIFSGKRIPAVATQASPEKVAASQVQDVEDEFAWMHQTADDVEDPAAKFREIKQSYRAKKQAGRAKAEDDILFIRAEREENARKKRLKEDYIRARGEDESDNEGAEHPDPESLFIAQGSAHGVSQKRKRPNNGEDYDSADERRERTLARQRRQNNVPEDELEASMMAGIEEALSKERKASRKQTNPRGSKSYKDKLGQSEKSKSKKSKEGTEKGTRKAGKGTRKGKPSSDTEMQTPKGRRQNRERKMMDAESMFSNNVYTAANSNVGIAALPVMTEKNKAAALKALLASVPIEDRKTVRGEKQHIIDATKTLGKYRVRPDGKGGWKLRGMNSSLMNHQVQGAAWMRERETGVTQPLGGLLADEMGFGKTVMMIACMVANPPKIGELNKTTLVVATPALCSQWEREFQKHAAQGTFPRVIRYHASARIVGTNALEVFQTADVVLTTYTEVVKSYPSWKPPKELVTREDQHQWWTEEFEKSRGLLHKIMFHRVVLDEAQAIKNHKSKTSIACRGLNAKHRWALSGTPIQNSIYELYPILTNSRYFKFLRVKHTGNYEVFADNFCDKNSALSAGRLNAVLSQFMIRRTYLDRLFGKPLIQMPKNTEMTIEVEFNQVERAVYDIVRNRYIHKINSYQHDGILEKRYNNVLTMLLRLRQLTGHILMLQGTIEDLIQVEDIERLWDATAGEVNSPDGEGRDMLVQMKRILAEKTAILNGEVGGEGEPASPPKAGEWDGEEQTPPLVFKFRKYLRTLAKDKSKWADLKEPSLCHKCSDVPDEPWVTSCMHIYCKECLLAMSSEAADNDEDSATCLECGTIYSESHPCEGLKELAIDREVSLSSSSGESTSGRKRRRNHEAPLKWIDIDGQILPSSKVAALTAQVDTWLKDDPSGKIIIFTQFHMMLEIIGRVCQSRKWGSQTYHGKMSHQARDIAIQTFREDDTTKVLIASLKCGGVGLNLTMASRVICIDLWWNSSVEQQAFCRIFRIGQESETYITRFVVKNTVDEKLQVMQKKKKEEIDTVMDTKGVRPSMRELLRLFGTVGEDENDKPFILVDDENEFAREVPIMPDEEDGEGVGGHRPPAKVGPLPWE